jgi:L-alanine-DL-glutamate epimerase-like enolase superfamily enzyme
MTAPRITVEEVRLHERAVVLRLPFRFGVVTLTEAPQAFVRLRIRLPDGSDHWGLAAELMVPKWFDKDASLSNEQNFDQLRLALGLYRDAILANGAATAFGHFAGLYRAHLDAGRASGLNPLAAGFGPALIDRAVMDALCRASRLSFAAAMRADLAAIAPTAVAEGFAGFGMKAFLADLVPAASIHARHTVGMVDPLTAADQPAGARVGDGLPETLEEVIATYGHRFFKLKLRGDRDADLDRLTAIAAVLDRTSDPYFVTLDGNEQYDDAAGVLDLLDAAAAVPRLERLMDSILFVEQPVHRAAALAVDIRALAARLPVIIDESDAELSSFEEARARGYAGVSSKNCKGVYKSLINLARCRMWSRAGAPAYFMSAEDLTCQAGVAVQQDLALVALLGLSHVERNGHHYVNGMAGASEAEQQRFLDAHPGLYHRVDGRVSLAIRDGAIDLRSLACAGFGTAAEPDWDAMGAMAVPDPIQIRTQAKETKNG